MAQENAAATQAKKEVKVSEIQQLLKDGLSRKDIAKHYGTTAAAIKRVFEHPKLKGLRTHAGGEMPFELLDDTPEAPAKKAKAAPVTAADGTQAETPAPAGTEEKKLW